MDVRGSEERDFRSLALELTFCYDKVAETIQETSAATVRQETQAATVRQETYRTSETSGDAVLRTGYSGSTGSPPSASAARHATGARSGGRRQTACLEPGARGSSRAPSLYPRNAYAALGAFRSRSRCAYT